MTPSIALNITFDQIYDLSYPLYIAGIPPNSIQILHIPGEFEYEFLEETISYTIEAYKTESKLYLFDVIPLHLWKKKICNIPYEKRLKSLRTLCTSQIANFKRVIDLPILLVDNPHELSDYCEGLRSKGYSKARLMDVNTFYVFGECAKGEIMELQL